jgi:hypothetical protein
LPTKGLHRNSKDERTVTTAYLHIEGGVDFIFGNAAAVFDHTEHNLPSRMVFDDRSFIRKARAQLIIARRLALRRRPHTFAQTCFSFYSFSLQSRGGPYILEVSPRRGRRAGCSSPTTDVNRRRSIAQKALPVDNTPQAIRASLFAVAVTTTLSGARV